MAQLVVSAASAAVGFLVGGPTGAQIGWTLGSIAGASLFGPKLQGPRSETTPVVISSYGLGIPHVYGVSRVACPTIWQDEIVESSKTERGGKGGPKVTSYSYSQSFAVLVAEGEINGIRRMWCGAKCVYDARPEATQEQRLESSRFRQYWTLYTGTESQSPDPTIEAVVGSGKVPALRGWSYIVFDDLPLEKFGNAQPQVNVETIGDADEENAAPVGTTEREPLFVYPWSFAQQLTSAPWSTLYDRPIHTLGDVNYSWVDEPVGVPSTSTSFSDMASRQAAAYGANGGNFRNDAGRYSYKFTGAGYWFTGTNARWNIQSGGATLGDDPEYVYYKTSYYTPQVIRSEGGFNYQTPEATHTAIRPSFVGVSADVMFWRLVHQGGGAPPMGYSLVFWSQDVFSPGPGLPSDLITTWFHHMLSVSGKRKPYHPPKTCRPGSPFINAEGSAEVQGDADWCVLTDGSIIPNRNWTIASGTAKQLCAIEYRNGTLYQNAVGPVLLSSHPDYNNATFWDAQATAAIAAGTMKAGVTYPVVVSEWAESVDSDARQWEVPARADGAVQLSAIVSHICTQAGLTAGQIDVTELTDSVLGYMRPTRMAARAALEPLRLAFLFDAVESGSKIVFRKRGRSVSATVQADDLGAGVDRPENDRVRTERGQEAEMPDVVTVTYIDADLDYQVGTQEARRRAGHSDQQQGIDIPVVMLAGDAAKLANVWLYSAWQERAKRFVSTTLAYAAIEPTDVIEVNDGDS